MSFKKCDIITSLDYYLIRTTYPKDEKLMNLSEDNASPTQGLWWDYNPNRTNRP